MPEDLKTTYRLARIASFLGSVLMYVLLLLVIINFAVYFYAVMWTEALCAISQESRLLLLATVFVPLPLEWLLAEFLRNFGCGHNPFGTVQSLRLVAAGMLAMLYATLNSIAPQMSGITVIGGSVPIGIDSGPSLGLLDITITVFFICLAMVIRYGYALKEDSDSFI